MGGVTIAQYSTDSANLREILPEDAWLRRRSEVVWYQNAVFRTELWN
jgi:hypothetical protein